MRRALLALTLLAVSLVPALATPPASLDDAKVVLAARIAALTPPVTAAEGTELKSLTTAQASLLAYGGGADKTGLKYLAGLVKGIEKALSPDPDVQAILGVVRDHQNALAAAARADAVARLALISVEKNRLKVAAAIASGDAALAAANTAWATSASGGAKGQAKAIGTYQKALASAEKALTKDPAAGAVRYPGLSVAAETIPFLHEGEVVAVDAYPGEVIVVFDPLPPAITARALLVGLGATVLAQIPNVGVYVAGVVPGQESTFIQQVRTQPGVYLAYPHLVTRYGSTGVTVIDDCDGTHGGKVKAVLTNHGVTVNNCRIDGYSSPIFPWTIDELERDVRERGTNPTLVNISTYTGWPGGTRWENVTDEVQRRKLVVENVYNLKTLLKAISQLPLPYRENLVVTLCAGNNHAPLDGILAEIAEDPVLLAILHQHFLIVGSKGQPFSNYAAVLDDDFAWVSNPEAADGTSFAAPYALALISKVMDQRGVSAAAALQIVKEAVAANPGHELVEAEVLPAAPGGDTYVGTITGATTDTLDGSVWRATVALELLLTVNGTGTVGDPYLNSLDFTGNVTETLEHCADDGGCDPGGVYGVAGMGDGTSLGKVIVTALLAGTSDDFTVRLTDGTLSGDRTTVTGTVTVNSVAFDTPVTKTVTFTVVP